MVATRSEAPFITIAVDVQRAIGLARVEAHMIELARMLKAGRAGAGPDRVTPRYNRELRVKPRKKLLISMRIPHAELSPTALRGVVQEFVTRDGTDHSSVERRIEAVLRQLDAGRVEVHFDEESETCNIVPV